MKWTVRPILGKGFLILGLTSQGMWCTFWRRRLFCLFFESRVCWSFLECNAFLTDIYQFAHPLDVKNKNSAFHNYKHKGSVGPWVLFWALKKALKRANSLKKTLLRANPLFWVLKKVFKKVSLIKRVLKKVLLWVINSKKCSKKSGLLKKVKFESSAQKRAHLSWTSQKNAQKSGLH